MTNIFSKLERKISRVSLNKSAYFQMRNSFLSWSQLELRGKEKKEFIRMAALKYLVEKREYPYNSKIPQLKNCIEEFKTGILIPFAKIYLNGPFSEEKLTKDKEENYETSEGVINTDIKMFNEKSPLEFFKSQEELLSNIYVQYKKTIELQKKYASYSNIENFVTFTKEEVSELFPEGIKLTIRRGVNQGRYCHIDLGYKKTFEKIDKKIQQKSQGYLEMANPLLKKYASLNTTLKKRILKYLGNYLTKEGKDLLEDKKHEIEFCLLSDYK